MHHLTSLWLSHTSLAVFVATLAEQLGLPLPASTIVFAAGVLAGAGHVSILSLLLSGLIGSLLGDWVWYGLGRLRGQQVLKFLCKMSLEPDSCVRRTEERFLRFGPASLIIAKFIPGIGTLIRPLSAVAGVKPGKFLLYDGIGTVLYVGIALLLGAIFSEQARELVRWLRPIVHTVMGTALVALVVFVVYKYIRRQQILRQWATLRLEPEDLKRKLEVPPPPIVVDLRSDLQIKSFPYTIPGSLRLQADHFERGAHHLPKDREVILFCDCPNEETSARMAILLHRQGYASARPLRGGISDWHERDYPVESMAEFAAAPELSLK